MPVANTRRARNARLPVNLSVVDRHVRSILAPCFERLQCDTVSVTSTLVDTFSEPAGWRHTTDTILGHMHPILGGAQLLNIWYWVRWLPRDIWVLTTREPAGYVQHVTLVEDGAIGYTPRRYWTWVNSVQLEKQARGYGGAAGAGLTRGYANVFVHEAIYLGLMGRGDIGTGTPLERPSAAVIVSLTITEAECETIREKLDVE